MSLEGFGTGRGQFEGIISSFNHE